MVFPAKFGALTEIYAFFFRLKPKLRQTTRHGILFDAKGWDGPTVDHIRACQLHYNDLPNRHHNGCVGRQ